MPTNELATMAARLARLERRAATWQWCTAAALAALVLVVGAAMQQPPAPASQPAAKPAGGEVLRVRGLIVVDENGKDRVVIGPPPAGMTGIQHETGVMVLDPDGARRFSAGVLSNRWAVMTVDAPGLAARGANAERIGLIVTPAGQPMLRLLDNETNVRGRFYLDPQFNPLVDLLTHPTHVPRLIRRVGVEMMTVLDDLE